MGPRRRWIIDTDCGGDDAIGIMAALTDPDTEIMALTVVWGNVNVDQGMENLGKLLDFYGRDIPFYRGASGPLVGEPETVQWGGFGKDGFGDADFPTSHREQRQSSEHAALAIARLLSEVRPGPDEVVQLVCIGPLTNIALAIRLAPEAFGVLGSSTCPAIIIMGGTSEAKGNSSMVAEFNIHCDPEAAHVVFNHKGICHPIQVVSWETTVNCAVPWVWYDSWVGRVGNGSKPPNPTQRFISRLLQRLETFTRPQEDGTRADTGDAEVTQDVTCVIPDAVAIIAALFPEAVASHFYTYMTVELHGRETRGETCIDWYGTEQSMAKRGRWINCDLVTKVSSEKFFEIMQRIVDFPLESNEMQEKKDEKNEKAEISA